MKICMAAVEQREDIRFGISQIQKYAQIAASRGAELILFPEAFLQGFEGLTFAYQKDIEIAVSAQGAEIAEIRKICRAHEIAVGFGYFEAEGGVIYSAYHVLDRTGETLCNYRRRSKGWKELHAGADYREGTRFVRFALRNKTFGIVLCGDFWTDELLDDIAAIDCDCMLWPVYIDFPVTDWLEEERAEYLRQTSILGMPVAFVNAYVENPDRANGGAFLALHGKPLAELPMGGPNLLYAELPDADA